MYKVYITIRDDNFQDLDNAISSIIINSETAKWKILKTPCSDCADNVVDVVIELYDERYIFILIGIITDVMPAINFTLKRYMDDGVTINPKPFIQNKK